jgi:hypothetical protein
MAKSIKVIPKPEKRRPGRPATGKDPLIALRMPPEERQAVEAWAANRSDKLSLSKAIRELIQLGLAVGAKRTRTPKAD